MWPSFSSIENRLYINAIILVLLAFISLSATVTSAEDSELTEFRSQIRTLYDMKEAAFAANDPEPILTRFYHSEVISTGPDGGTHTGIEGLRPVYNEVIAGDVRIESYSTFVKGDAGWDWVNFHVTPPAEANEDPFTFKMLFLWARENDEWRSHGEMYVTGEFTIDGKSH
jgi:hypothetical protein